MASGRKRSNENLIRGFSDPEKGKERARQAGINSGITRRKRKSMREEFEIALSIKGVQKSIIVAMIKAAQEGSVSAAQFIRDTIGEKPVEKTETRMEISEEARKDAILIELEKLESV